MISTSGLAHAHLILLRCVLIFCIMGPATTSIPPTNIDNSNSKPGAISSPATTSISSTNIDHNNIKSDAISSSAEAFIPFTNIVNDNNGNKSDAIFSSVTISINHVNSSDASYPITAPSYAPETPSIYCIHIENGRGLSCPTEIPSDAPDTSSIYYNHYANNRDATYPTTIPSISAASFDDKNRRDGVVHYPATGPTIAPITPSIPHDAPIVMRSIYCNRIANVCPAAAPSSTPGIPSMYCTNYADSSGASYPTTASSCAPTVPSIYCVNTRVPHAPADNNDSRHGALSEFAIAPMDISLQICLILSIDLQMDTLSSPAFQGGVGIYFTHDTAEYGALSEVAILLSVNFMVMAQNRSVNINLIIGIRDGLMQMNILSSIVFSTFGISHSIETAAAAASAIAKKQCHDDNEDNDYYVYDDDGSSNKDLAADLDRVSIVNFNASPDVNR